MALGRVNTMREVRWHSRITAGHPSATLAGVMSGDLTQQVSGPFLHGTALAAGQPAALPAAVLSVCSALRIALPVLHRSHLW